MPHIFSRIAAKRQVEVIRDLDQAGVLNNDYLLLIMLSCIIATFGLVLDSAAVIIGAMLIAPLMSPILRCALALIRGDLARFAQAAITLLVGVLLAIVLSTLFGLLVSNGPYNFLEELPGEVVGRTRPNLFDLVVALAGGTAAAYALAQPRLSAALPGVAIATALMPPLCTIGIGLSQSRTDISGGALLLFLANLTAILFASSLTFAIVGFRPTFRSFRTLVLTPVLLVEGLLVLLVVVALSGVMVRVIGEAREDRTIRTTLMDSLAQLDDSSLVDFERQTQPDHLVIVATVRSPQQLTHVQANDIQRQLATRLQRTIALKLLIIPITSLDPLVPPTLTPTLAPDATATPTPIPTHTPTATPTRAPTSVPTSTPSPLPSATATRSPLPTVTPVAYAVVGATGGHGVNVRRAPGDAAIITVLRDRTVIQLRGQATAVDGGDWVEVVLPDGRVGWIADDYLVPYQQFVAP